MNCDDVFDCLTDPRRGPAPDLERHLSHCPRCRQLREVLSPALSLFAGDDPPREPGGDSFAASGATPLLTPEAVQLAERTAHALGLPSRPRRPARRWTTWTASAAGLLVGGLLTAAAIWWQTDAAGSASNRSAALPPLVADHCLWPTAGSSADAPPRSVILSCVACHLDGSLQ